MADFFMRYFGYRLQNGRELNAGNYLPRIFEPSNFAQAGNRYLVTGNSLLLYRKTFATGATAAGIGIVEIKPFSV